LYKYVESYIALNGKGLSIVFDGLFLTNPLVTVYRITWEPQARFLNAYGSLQWVT